MQIVIDITEKLYKALKQDDNEGDAWDAVEAIINGTPLPKEHGRLIDADAFIMAECFECDGYCDVCNCDCLNCKSEYRCEFIKDVDSADVVIEADKEEAEE